MLQEDIPHKNGYHQHLPWFALLIFFPPPTNWVRLSWPSLSPPKAKEEEPPEAPEGLVTDETEEKESDRVKAQPFRTKGT